LWFQKPAKGSMKQKAWTGYTKNKHVSEKKVFKKGWGKEK